MHARVLFSSIFFMPILWRIFCILFIAVSIYFLCSFTEMKAKTVCARAQAAFLQSSADHSVKEVAKSLKKTQQ